MKAVSARAVKASAEDNRLSSDPDIDLLPGLRAGEPSALKALMDRHLDRIHGLAWHMSGDRALAEDVSQETFLRFWQTAPSWDSSGQATILTWLRRVATRICIDEKRRKRPIYTDTVPEQMDLTPRADLELVRSDTANAVQSAMMRLPDRQRAALVLSFYQQVSQAEGSAAMGVSEKAYESLLSRAKVKLKSELMTGKESLAL